MADAVATAFASALTRTRGGLSFAALRDGQVIYDVHGGWADREHTRAWETGTRPTIFSGSRGLVAMCLAILVDRGALGLDAPGPPLLGGFATAGKPRVTVGELASHRAGLPAVQREKASTCCAPRAGRLRCWPHRRPVPSWAGVPCYHAVTFAWLCGELDARLRAWLSRLRSTSSRTRPTTGAAATSWPRFTPSSPRRASVANLESRH